MTRWMVPAVSVALLLFSPALHAAESGVAGHLDAAQAAQARGDLTRAAGETEAALLALHARLSLLLAECLPPPPAGWAGDAPEPQSLLNAGGGLSVSRAYSREEATLNVQFILDNPAVAAAAAQIQPGVALPANARRVHLGAEEGVLRWDASTRSGEITLVIAGRLLMQIEGEGLATGDILLDMARTGNLANARKLLIN